MYDMYPWDKPADRSPGQDVPEEPAEQAVRAVQAALDRRDNGGDAGTAAARDYR